MELERCVEKAERLIRRGYRKEKILILLEKNKCDGEESYEIARCRIKIRDKFSKKNLYFDTYGLRYSTPEIVGRYRAKRIRGYTIADISCGVGMQAIFLAETNKEVLCVDIEPRRIKYARENAKIYGIRNMIFATGDCFSNEIYNMARRYDVIYSDPARSESERERSLHTLMPSPLKIMEKYGNKNYVFDLPPQISQEKIPSGWEKEYISLNGKIRRLTAYVGDLQEHDRRAVALPSGEEIYADEHKWFTKKIEFSNYIYIVDESIYYANLLDVLEKKYGIWYIQTGKRRTLASSSLPVKSGFLRAFKIIYFTDSLDEIIHFLRKEGYGKITLRFNVKPEKYWKIRNELERKLNGNAKASLFKVGKDYLVGIECNIT